MRDQPEKRCLSCGKQIIAGRTDKRYCDDACRARGTRQRVKEEQSIGYEDGHRAVLAAIKRNYRLLKTAIGTREEWTVDFAELYFKGFDQNFYTSTSPLPNGDTRFYCFEIGWEKREASCLFVTVDPTRLRVFNAAEPDEINFAPS